MYTDWEKHAQDTYIIDIETDSLHPGVIWVMCWRNLRTKEIGELTNENAIRKWFDERTDNDRYVGHNILKFDGPVLNRLCGVRLSPENCIDTLVLSTLYSPSIDGGHSLDAWGERIGKEKIVFDDWSKLSPEMITYCHRDVEITAEIYQRLLQTLNKIEFSEGSIWLQHKITEIIDQQHKNGFQFDGERAINFYRQLRSREEELENEIRKVFLPERIRIAERPMYKKDGTPTAIYLKDQGRYILERDDVGGRYTAFEDVEFNVGSSQQRVDKLLSLGWEPREFTEKTKKGGGGNPKPFDKGDLSPSLTEFVEENDLPEVKLITKWMSINGRANTVNTWLEAWNEEDGKIHGKLFTANTLRFRHQSPNTANIPAVRVGKDGVPLYGEDGYYTYEARDLWVARSGRVLVGTDAAGLELRMLAHYLNRPDFTKQVVEGDPHQYNADTVGITRPQAKTLIYAIMYGAAAPKIAKTLGVSVREGAKIREMFLDRLGLGDLIAECQREQAMGRVSLVDGSQVICPSPHAALNYKLQGGGARVMSLGAVFIDRAIKQYDLDSLKVGDIHDEWQFDVHPDSALVHAALAEEAIVKAGLKLKLNVPLDAESKIGLTWAETH